MYVLCFIFRRINAGNIHQCEQLIEIDKTIAVIGKENLNDLERFPCIDIRLTELHTTKYETALRVQFNGTIMTDSTKEESTAVASSATVLSVPSPTFFDDIKFYTSGNVSEKVHYNIRHTRKREKDKGQSFNDIAISYF